MAAQALVNPQIVINNVPIRYVPNSLKFDLGLGEQSTKATAGGGGSSEVVHFANVESNVGMVSFEMYSTNVTLESHKDWKALGGLNVIELLGEGGVRVFYPNMAHTNKVEFDVGDAKTVPFTFDGGVAIS